MCDMTPDAYGSGAHPAWLDIDWSEHLQWLMVDGRPVNVLDAGSGEQTIVFIHGHSACWQHWLEQLPRYMTTHRVIALDLPGFGRSPLPRDGISMTNYARTVESVCEQLDVSAACVVGNSMGGFVSAELAIIAPQLVERLVLVAAAGMSSHYLGIPTTLMEHPGAAAATRVLFGLGGVPDAQARALAKRPRGRRLALDFVCTHSDRLHPALVYELIKGAGRPGGAPAVAALAGYDFKDRVPGIACPTLIVWGDRDYLVPVASAKLYADAIEDATMVVYDDTGHLPMVERPGLFNRDLDEFLRDEEPGGDPTDVLAEENV